MKRFCAVSVGVLWMLIVLGCAPAVVLENPVEWPQEYAERQLQNTPNAFIYAGSDAAAGEADRLVIAVAKDFQTMTGRKATKGLVFVTDVKDAPLIRNLEKIVDLEMRKKSAEIKAKEPAADKAKTQAKPEDPLEKWRETQKKMKKLGLDMDMLLRAVPVPVPKTAASSLLGLPKDMTDKSDWIMAMPTKAVIRDLVQKMVVKGIEKADCGPLGKAMAGLLLGAVNIERTMTDAFAMTRDVVLFSIWTGQQADWSEDKRKKTIDAYAEKRSRETLGGLMAAMARQTPPPQAAKAKKGEPPRAPDTDAHKGEHPPPADGAP